MAKKISPETDMKIIGSYLSGIEALQISKELHISCHYIYKVLKEHHIPLHEPNKGIKHEGYSRENKPREPKTEPVFTERRPLPEPGTQLQLKLPPQTTEEKIRMIVRDEFRRIFAMAFGSTL